jgi:CRP-like cAMP-binding protein
MSRPKITVRQRHRGSVLLPEGTTLFDSRHPPRRIYQLERGHVQLSTDSEVILDRLGPGDFFGEKFLLSAPRCRQVAETVSPAKVESFERHELLERVQQDRRFAARLLRGLAHRIDRHEQSIRDLAKERPARRLALLLSRLLPHHPAAGWIRLPWNPTNPELARRIGTTRWRVSRLVNQFQRLGWLRREKGLWVHREGLGAFLQTPEDRR